jgi:hypothetical protein
MNKKTCTQCGQEIKEKVIQSIPAKELEWGAISDEEMDWHEAIKWCEAQGKGWRLPTRVELIQAFDEGIEFPGNYFWSSTEYYSNTALAWYVYLYNGNTNSNTKASSNLVRCVR